MFTGIIQEIGEIADIRKEGSGVNLRVEAAASARELRVNDSVAMNGVCLTVVDREDTSFRVQAVEETLAKTTLQHLRTDDHVNLELPLKLEQRLGGHIVLGHVDTVGKIRRIEPRSTSWMFFVSYPSVMRKYLIPVGSVAIDGVSLTTAVIDDDLVGISVIPHTMENTIFRYYKQGSAVNIEFDILGKYVIQYLEAKGSDNVGEKEFPGEKLLRDSGF